jgi:ligand-binding sensor domain-containing protein
MKANRLTQIGLSLALALCFVLGPVHRPIARHSVKAQDDVWTTYTNSNYVNDLAIEGDYLWAATEGGVVRWNVRDGTYVKYTRGDGLADNQVQAVGIDLDGSKWFGTHDSGVSHFDGTTWTTYTESNSGLASNHVTTIAIDNDGGKWFGTFLDGVSHFDGTIWTAYNTYNSGLAHNDVRAIAIDLDSSKWFGTWHGEVSHFDGTTWTTYDTYNSGLADDDVQAIAIDLDGSKWFGTWCGGVSHFDGDTWTTYTQFNSGLASSCVGAIVVNNDGSKWFGTSDGVSHFDGTTWTTYNTSNSSIASGRVEAIVIDSNDNKWFGFKDGGINKFDGTTWTTFTTPDSLMHNYVQAIAVERSGGRWFGTGGGDGGASWQVGNIWVNYTTSNSKLKNNDIQAIVIDNDDTVWFGTRGGVSHFDGDTWTTYDTYNSGLEGNNVQAIAIDLDGSKWFGISFDGVSHFDDDTWTTYNTSNSRLADDDVRAIAIDSDGSKWFGTRGGVSHFDGITWTTYNTSNSDLADDDVRAIAIDSDGSKWFGTYGGGVSHFDDTIWATYNTYNSDLTSNRVWAIAIDNDGSKWFGTHFGGGVSCFDGTAWRIYNTSNSGLTDDDIWAIAIDNNDTKWFGTTSGLSRFGPPPETETYIRVIDEDGNPLPGTWVYRNGILIADADGFPYQTNSLGIFLVNGLAPSDRLVALAPRHKQPTTRAAHGPPDQSWAYTVSVTNAHLDDQGHINVTQTYDPATGEYLLTTDRDNTLVTFKLVVSVEWDATDDYLDEIARAVQYASDYLYDLSDGQMAFGQVAIYDNGDHWADADIQISTKNIVRPHAYIGGITSGDTSHIIRVGRGWDGNSGDQGAWDQEEGYRTLAHEFGHYALYLWDEYFAYISDEHGNLINEVPTYCTGPENRNPDTEATNASVMDYQYTTSELSAQGVPGLWSHLCQETAQWQMNGESAWETVVRMYADAENPPRWQFTSPIDRGSVMAGPNDLSSKLSPLPEVTIHNSGSSESPRHLTVYDPEGKPYWGAIVALYKQDGRVIGQGFTDGNGRLKVYGTEVGDTLRAASFDAGLAGRVTVGPEMSLGLTLEPVLDVTAQMAGGIPHMRVVAEPSQDPDQIDLLVFLHDFGPGADPRLIVTQPGSEVGYAPSLSYSPTTDTYEGQISFSANERGMGRIRAMGAVGDSLVRLQSTYRLQRVLNDQSHDVYSDDGNLSLHLEMGSLPGNEAYLVVMPPGAVPGPLPAGLLMVGDPYDITASGALMTLQKPGILKLRYDGALVTSSSVPEGLAIYRWDPNSGTWQGIGGSVDEAQKAVVAPVQTLGTFALLAPLGDWNMPPSSLIFLPVILKNAP